MARNKIKIDIETVVNGQKEVGKLTVDLQQLERAHERVKQSMSAVTWASVAQGAEAASSAVNGLCSVMKDLTGAYAVQEEAERKLQTVMQQRMNATSAEIDSIKQLCSAQQDLGVIGDEVQLAGAQQLATFLEQKSSLDILIPAMNNLVAQQRGLNATQGDCVSVANLMGKAMTGQTSALKRAGIIFTEAQEKMLKYGDESQRAATMADVIRANVGDMNAELAKTDSGRIKQLENTLGDMKEKLGSMVQGALPFVQMAAAATTATAGVIKLVAGIKAASVAIYNFTARANIASVATRILGVNSRTTAQLALALRTALNLTSAAAKGLAISIRSLMIATGVGAVIAALTWAIDALMTSATSATDAMGGMSEAEQSAAEAAERLKRAREEENRNVAAASAQLSIYLDRIKNFKGSKAEEKKLVDELNDVYGETIGYFSSLSGWYRALTSDSAAYIQNLKTEAEIRIKTMELENLMTQRERLLYDDKGNKRFYSTKNQVKITGGTNGGTQGGFAAYEPTKTEYIPNSSPFDKVMKDISDYDAKIDSLTKKIANLSKNLAPIPVRGATKRPTYSGSHSGGTPSPVWTADPKNIKQIEDNIKVLQKKQETASLAEVGNINKQIAALEELKQTYKEAGKEAAAVNPEAKTLKEIKDNISALDKQLEGATAETAEELNKQRDLWQEKYDHIANLGKKVKNELTWTEVPQTLKQISDNLAILQDRLANAATEAERSNLNQQIEELEKLYEAWAQVGKSADSTNAVYRENAKNLQEYEENIQSLQNDLKTATIEDAESINKRIEHWSKLADAVKNAGKSSEKAGSQFREGYSAVKGITSGVTQMSEALKGNRSLWEKLLTMVDAAISVFDGITTVIKIIDAFSSAQKVAAATTTAQAAATTAEVAATTESAAATAVAAAVETAATKNSTAAFLELAAAKSYAMNASLGFVGIAKATAQIGTIVAATKAVGAMKFAQGGIAYGPTLGLFGEYAGASHNPEVVAPLDKLKALIAPSQSVAGPVEFRVRGKDLYAVLNRYDTYVSRT